MKRAKTISEQVETIIKLHKTSKTEENEQLEFVDFNKSIEKMLTAKSTEENKKVENILAA